MLDLMHTDVRADESETVLSNIVTWVNNVSSVNALCRNRRVLPDLSEGIVVDKQWTEELIQ